MSGLNITRGTGQLNRVAPMNDGVVSMVITGAAVADKINLSEPVRATSIKILEQKGITEGNNPLAVTEITDFFSTAGEGAVLYFMLVANSNTLVDIVSMSTILLNYTEGKTNLFLISYKPANDFNYSVGGYFDETTINAIQEMRNIVKDFTTNNIPFVAILPGFGLNLSGIGNMELDLRNSCIAINAFCKTNNKQPSQGLLAGVLAKIQVHENCGAVDKGKISDTAYLCDTAVGLGYNSYIEHIGDLMAARCIFGVKRGQKSGYYFEADPTITPIDSDYSSISWNRVINKVHRIAADVLLNKLNSDVEINPSTGKLHSAVCSNWESEVERAVRNQMMQISNTRKKEISGVKCTVNPDSDIINDTIDATISIVRKGQAKTINVTIQYTPNI